MEVFTHGERLKRKTITIGTITSFLVGDEYSYTYQYIGSDIAGTQYDVAHVKWGGSWVMPSIEQIKELTKKCTLKWITINGVKGIHFTAPNGNSIFLTLTAADWGSHPYASSDGGFYWSSTYKSPGVCTLSYYTNEEYYWEDNVDPCYGASVRPVSK